LATPTRSAGRQHGKLAARLSSRQPVVRRSVVKAASQPAPAGNTTPNGKPANGKRANGKPEPKILFQKFFKSVGPRTYAAQVKELSNGNQLLVLTEAKRDEQTGDVRKTRLLVFGEDLSAFFRLLHETAGFIRANPLAEDVRKRRERFWSKKARESRNHAQASAK
jgi:hypothetical protein